jgi:hypothetical protein
MKIRTLRNTAIALLIAGVIYLIYQQASDSRVPLEAAATPANTDRQSEAAAKSANPQSTPNAAGSASGKAAEKLTAAEQEQIGAAMASFRRTLEHIERANATVTVDREVGGRTHVVAVRITPPQTEQIGQASESLSAQLHPFAAGTSAWREARLQGEKLMSEFTAFKTGFKTVLVTGPREKPSMLVEFLTNDENNVVVRENGAIEAEGQETTTQAWSIGQQKYHHLFTDEGRPNLDK